jgi:ankyrin repeat protein
MLHSGRAPYATEGGSTAVIEALLDAPGVDAGLRTDAGFTPLHLAAMAGHVASTRLFICHARARTEKFLAATAAADDHAAAAATMKATAARAHACGGDPMSAAETMTAMEEEEAAAVAVAAIEVSEDAAGEALDLDEPASSSYTALHLAAMRKHDRVVCLLLREGSRVAVCGVDGKTPLHLAAASGADSVVRALLSAVRDPAVVINDRTVRGETPALLAANAGHLSTVEMLVAAGGDPFIPDDSGNTCLHGQGSAPTLNPKP